MNIVFAGTPAFSAIHLRALLDSRHSLVAVYTQPDRPAGRGKKLSISPVKQLALDAGLPLEQPPSLKSEQQQANLRSYAADLMVVVAYGLLLPEAVLTTPRYGCINVHASILPRWRGAAPIERAIEAGDRSTGITIMQMDIGLDTGDMLRKAHCPIHANDTATQLHDRLAEIGPQTLLNCLQEIEEQRLQPEPQNHSQSTYAKKLHKQEGAIDWQLPAATLHNKIRAFNPFPMAYSHIDQQRVRLTAAETVAINGSPTPGAIIAADKSGLTVATGEGGLKITQLQLPGKKNLPFRDVLNGFSHLFVSNKNFA